MNVPKVSVIVTTRNRCDTVQRAIRSVLEQDYSNFDLHIVDDASDDDTRETLKPLGDSDEKVFYWRHDKRKGLSAARNTGLAHSDGEHIAFLDDDDAWKPDCLRKRIDRLLTLSSGQIETLGVIYCGCEIHIEHEVRIVNNLPKMRGDIGKYARDHLILPTIPSTCLFPRRVLERVGQFDEELSSSVDHDIWMQLAVGGYHAFAVNEPLVITFSMKHKKSMLADTLPRIRGVEQFIEKWTPTYKEWRGEKGAWKFIKHYRAVVLGELAAQKFTEGVFRESWRLLHHVLSSNGRSPSTWRILGAHYARCIIRFFTPKPLIALVKGEDKGTR
ncbi:MAG: glycosyltransferase family 2 protein [Proteobacteria bacterium]|nr:glycosyltransferase family 2 protein [Pseudomonadota bacterium]